MRSAVLFDDLHVLCDVDELARQVTGVRRLERGVRQTFTRTVGRNEVLKNVQTLFEVRNDRRFDDRAVRFRHQTAHTGQLTDLCRGTPRTRVGHHVNGVEPVFVGLDHLHHVAGQRVVDIGPDVDDLVVAFLLRQKARFVLLLNLFHFRFGGGNQFRLFARDDDVIDRDRNAGGGRVLEAEVFQVVEERRRHRDAAVLLNVVDQRVNRFLLHDAVPEVYRHERGQDILDQQTADGRRDHPAVDTGTDTCVQIQRALFQRNTDLVDVREQFVRTDDAVFLQRKVVDPEDHVLRRRRDRFTGRRQQDVHGREHQDLRFRDRLGGKRDVNRHLVTVEVGVERRTDERMQLDRLAVDQFRVKRLD